MTGTLRYDVGQLHDMANRLFNTLIREGAVRVSLGELRDAATSLDSALGKEELSVEAFCPVANEFRQLTVFLCNLGTGLEQQDKQGLHPQVQQLALDHLGCWTGYLMGLAAALDSGTADAWVGENPPPPGQPGIPHD